MDLKTSKLLKHLESAESEAEMLVLAKKMGLTRSFFNIGGVIDVGEKVSANGVAKRAKVAIAKRNSSARRKVKNSKAGKQTSKKSKVAA
jgi:hypothetical protein